METLYSTLVFLCFQLLFTDTSGTTVTLTGSANYAVLDQTFRFTCNLTDDSSTLRLLTFNKFGQSTTCGVIVSTDSSQACQQVSSGTDYTCGCVSGQTGLYFMDIARVSVAEDEATWRCQRLNIYSNNISLSVYYAPKIQSTFPSSSAVTEFSRLQIDCSSYTTVGKPPSTSYTWTYGGSTFSSGSVLDINNIGRTMRGQYICTASNIVGSSNSSVAVDVQYAPKIQSTFPSSSTVTEFSRLQINCSAWTIPGNPQSTSYTWTYGGSTFSSGSVLDINNIGRNMRGEYMCTASNTVGSSNASVTVDVQYLDRPDLILDKTEVMENDTVSLTCNVASNPTAELEIRNMDKETVLVERVTNRLQFTVDRVLCLHNGSFLCSARNTQTRDVSTSSKKELNVLCKPRISNSHPSSTDVTRGLGDVAPLTVNVVGNPAPSFEWYVRENEQLLPIPTSTEHTIVSSRQASVLQITVRNTNDYGTYVVIVRNDVGSLQMTYTVSPLAPEPDRLGLGVGIGICVMIPVIIVILIMSVLLHRRQARDSKNTESGTNELPLRQSTERVEQSPYEDLTRTSSTVNEYEQLQAPEASSRT